MITFSCLIASPLPQNHRPASNSKAMTFVLLRTTEGTGEASVIPAPPAGQASNLEASPGVFSVGPVREQEEGEYTCVYQVSQEMGHINSTVSNKVRITVIGEDVLNLIFWPLLFLVSLVANVFWVVSGWENKLCGGANKALH